MDSKVASSRKLDFLIAGVQKGGTTSLHACLMEHPQVYMPQQKEIHFFDTEEYFKNDSVDYSLYHRHFLPSSRHKVMGEATPIYIYWAQSIKRIWSYNPDIKIIILLRNPISRAYSHWNMEKNRNAETVSFLEAVTTETQRLRNSLSGQHRVYSYIDRGFYVEQLHRLWTYFPLQNTLILRSDDLKKDPATVMKEVFRFLDVDLCVEILPKMERVGVYSEPMSLEAWDYLRRIFQPQIYQLEQLLRWDCSDWLRYDKMVNS